MDLPNQCDLHACMHENTKMMERKLVHRYKQIINQRINTGKHEYKHGNNIVPSCVLSPGNFGSMGLALSKVGFGSLHLFRDWMTLKAPKLFPTVVHTGLVGHPDPRPL